MLFHSDKTKDNLVAAMPRYEYYVRLFEGLEYEKGDFHTEEVRIDSGTVKINDNLNKSYFEIDFPPLHKHSG